MNLFKKIIYGRFKSGKSITAQYFHYFDEPVSIFSFARKGRSAIKPS